MFVSALVSVSIKLSKLFARCADVDIEIDRIRNRAANAWRGVQSDVACDDRGEGRWTTDEVLKIRCASGVYGRPDEYMMRQVCAMLLRTVRYDHSEWLSSEIDRASIVADALNAARVRSISAANAACLSWSPDCILGED